MDRQISSIVKKVALIFLEQMLVSTSASFSFVDNVRKALITSLIMAISIASLILFGFFVLYNYLLTTSLSYSCVVLIISFSLVFLILLSAILTKKYMNQMKPKKKLLASPDIEELVSSLESIAKAFMRGMNEPCEKKVETK